MLALLAVLAGCSDTGVISLEYYTPALNARFLRVYENEFFFPAENAETYGLYVESYDTPWGFTEVMDWLTLSQQNGNTSADVEMSVIDNPSGDSDRLGVFYLESEAEDWAFSMPLSVYQSAAEPYAVPEMDELYTSGYASATELMVEGNCSWSFESSKTWISAIRNEDGKSMTVYVDENATGSSRSGYLWIVYEGKTLASIWVYQSAAQVSVATKTLAFENTAGTYELKLTSEASWTAETSNSWIQVSPASGKAGESTIKISAVTNTGVSDRSGYVYIYIGGYIKASIPVTQRGLYLDWDASSLSFSSEEEEKTIRITSNTSWSVSVFPSWMSVSPTSGTGSQDVRIKVADNPEITSRTAKITLSQPGLSINSDLYVTQKGKTFQYGSSSIECSDKAQDIKVKVTTTGKWSAVSNDSWISVSPASTTGSADLIISVEENDEDGIRSGSVTLTIGNTSYSISVIQSGKYFMIDYGMAMFGSTGAELAVEISTNDSWTAEVENNDPWITLSQSSGTGNASFVATIADNPSVSSRSTMIVFTSGYGKSLKIQVNQAARYMTVDRRSVTFFASGGTSEDIQVSTDGKYSITCPDSWLSITEKEHDMFNVTASENTSKEMRQGTVTIKMTDLKEGSYQIDLPVLQAAQLASFVIQGYGDDMNWDLGTGSGATFTITGYGTDKNWDSCLSGNGLKVTITGYDEDINWDSNTSANQE